MEFSLHLLLLALLLPLVHCADPIYEKCSQNFTNKIILQENIIKLSQDLISNATSNGYAISTVGNSSDTVHGLAYCRGDIDAQACSSCMLDASLKLQEACPKSAEARIWYELCFIRYGNASFIGSLDYTDAHAWFSTKEIGDAQEFNITLWKLLNWVKMNAYSKESRFGMGKISSSINTNLTIYGMAQCSGDLNGLACMKCLEVVTYYMKSSCKDHVGCYIKSSSCVMRHETYNFLLAKSVPAYPDDIASVPAPAPAPATLV